MSSIYTQKQFHGRSKSKIIGKNSPGQRLYWRIGKNGIETNILEWKRTWDDIKINEYPAEFREALKAMKREPYSLQDQLDQLEYKPEVLVSKDAWVPTSLEQIEIIAQTDPKLQTYKEHEFYAAWAKERLKENAAIKIENDNIKKQIDELRNRGGKTRTDLIHTLIGSVLEDMSFESQQKVKAWTRDDELAQKQPKLYASTLDKAYEVEDWLFIFDAAVHTHLQSESTMDEFTRLRTQETQLEVLKTLKHDKGSLQRWIQRFDDQLELCETVGNTISDVMKRKYFVENLNTKIFENILQVWKTEATRRHLPDTYSGLKTYVINDYAQQSTIPERMKVLLSVTKGNISEESETEPTTEPAMNGKEGSKEGKDKPCFICGKNNHLYKNCYHYDKTKTVEECKEDYKISQAEKKANKEAKRGASKKESVPKKEDSKACIECNSQDSMLCAELFTEPCLLSKGVSINEIDFIYDSGTVNGVASIDNQDIINDLQEEKVYLEGVGGQTSLSSQYGNTIFGKTRILKNRTGSVLVSQNATKNMYQVINPTPDLFVLRGWKNNPSTRGKSFRFERDVERYGDSLLHCTMKIEEIKSFFVTETPLSEGESELVLKNTEGKDTLKNFYNPPKPVTSTVTIDAVQSIHRMYGHASADQMIKLLEDGAYTDVTKPDIIKWKSTFKCIGCIQGSMIEHHKVSSSNAAFKSDKPGEIAEADLMFVEADKDKKLPIYIQVDVASKMICAIPMKDKSENECLKAMKASQAEYKIKERHMQKLIFDREPGVISKTAELKQMGIELVPKATGQKAALAEVNIREIKKKARASKVAVKEIYGYQPPNSWNIDLCLDTEQVINRLPKSHNLSPYELFANKKVDYIRDMRVDWGEPIIVKKPKGLATTLEPTAEWAVPVRRIMNSTGVLKVYLLSSKRFAYRFKFERATPPQWVLDQLNRIDNGPIKFEKEETPPTEPPSPESTEDPEPRGLDNPNLADLLEQLENAEEVDTHLSDDKGDKDDEDNMVEEVTMNDEDAIVDAPAMEDTDQPTEVAPIDELAHGAEQQQGYRTRSGRLVKKVQRLVEEAYAVLKEKYDHIVEPTFILYQEALKVSPNEAKAALLKEVKKALSKKIWHPIHLKNMTREEKTLILPMMKNFVEKLDSSGEFMDYKVRILTRGDKQFETAESEGPVCRPESLRIVMVIGAHEDLEDFKVDITAAFMNTIMPKEVKHKWLRLDKDVSALLVELDPMYKEFMIDGHIVVEMDRLMYGYVEAPRFWYLTIQAVFIKSGYRASNKDKCVFIKRENDKVSICALTVDDCMFFATRDEAWIQQQIKILSDAFEEITVERTSADGISIVGMNMKRDGSKVILTQPKWENKVVEAFRLKNETSPNPALNHLMSDDETEELLSDQKQFMSLNSLLMYGATRTYPELLPVVGKLATKYNKATTNDLLKAKRVAEYVNAWKGNHRHVLAPKSLKMEAYADASYATHSDAKSQSGGTVGFETDKDLSCNIAFISSKQSTVAKSAGEAELVAENKIAEYIVWMRDLLDDLGYPQKEPTDLFVDSTCAMNMVRNGTGSFKRAKHIKVRYFWLKELIDEGIIKLRYMHTDELVADILTKPLQGSKFYYLLQKLIGWSGNEDVDAEEVSW